MGNRWTVYNSSIEHPGMNFRKLPKTSGVYQILNTFNQKRYIGYATNLRLRCKCHRVELRASIHANDHLQNSWNIYKERYFEFSVLQECSLDKLRFWEDYWARVLRTHDREYGYNVQPTDPIGEYVPMSEETKKKISIANKGKVYPNKCKAIKIRKERTKLCGKDNPWYGKKMSDESKQKMIASRKRRSDELFEKTGYRISQESLQKIRLRNACRGTMSEQTKLKIKKANSESKIGCKKVIDIRTGQVYESCIAAATIADIKRITLSRMLRGVYTNTTNLRYLDSNNNPIDVRTVKNKKIVSEETKKRMSERMRANPRNMTGINNPMYGVKQSDETKRKRAETLKRIGFRDIHREKRGKRIIDNATGTIYRSLADVADMHGWTRSNLSRMLLGKRSNRTSYSYI